MESPRPIPPEANEPWAQAQTSALRLFCGLLVLALSLVFPNLTRADEPRPQPPQPASTPAPITNVPAARVAKRVAIIPITSEFDHRAIYLESVERRIRTAVRAGADAIVFEFDVPGGFAGTTKLIELIQTCPVPRTVAWIHSNAKGGAALAALACKEIIIDETAELGQAKPIQPSGKVRGWQTAQQAFQALLPGAITDAVRSARDFNTAAGEYIRDEDLARAFVINDTDLWLIREKATGKVLCARRFEVEALFPNEPLPNFPVRAQGPSLDSIAASAKLQPSLRPTLDASQAGQWELVQPLPRTGDSLLLTGLDIATVGLAANPTSGAPANLLLPIRSDQDIAAFFQAKYVRVIEPSWAEGLLLFLTHPWVRTALIVIFLIATFVEMTHPGAAIPGLVALLALAAVIAPSVLIGMTQWWEVGMIVVGLLLLLLEIFVIPGFGVAGILGLVLLFVGLVATFMPAGAGLFPDSPREQSDLLYALSAVLLAMFTSGFGIFMLAKHLPSLPFMQHLILRSGDIESADPLLASMGADDDLPVHPGDQGITLTPMRPAGRIQIGDTVHDAVCEVGFLPAGQPVRVVSASAMRISVEATTPPVGPTT